MTRRDLNLRRFAVVLAGILSGMASAAVVAQHPPASVIRAA